MFQGGSSESVLHEDDFEWLEERLGRLHLLQRLRAESQNEAKMVTRGDDGWASPIREVLKGLGIYGHGLKNAECVHVKHHDVRAQNLPPAFDGFTILHVSDLHIDMSRGAIGQLLELLGRLEYDLCVLTGDYRGETFGPFDAAIEGLAHLRPRLGELVYGVLGNHDTIRMVPKMEEIGVQMLLNESVVIERGGQHLYLAGVDDAHFYRTHDIAKAVSQVPNAEFSILLSHTPEVYREAARADFDLLLSGHTHGGQICLPGSIPITLCADLPRHIGAGRWKYQNMLGYTSVGLGASLVPVRFNCPPEITLHHLQVEYERYNASL